MYVFKIRRERINIDNNELDMLRDNLSIVSGDFVVILVGRLIKSKGIE